MPAEHKVITHKPMEIRNPFRDDSGGDRAFIDLFLDKMNEAKHWRITAFGSLALFAVSLCLFAYSLSLPAAVPLLVNVMPSGEAQYLGEVRQSGELLVPEAAVHWQIRAFVSKLRSVSVDSLVLYNNINDCYAMISRTYEPAMTRMLRSSSPFELVGRIRRTVEIESVIRVTGSSYQIDWTETSVERSGSPVNKKFRGLVTINLIPPEPSFIRDNPLGIFIENFEWTEL